MQRTQPNQYDARRCLQRRAFSLLELVAVIAIIGLLGSLAATRFGTGAVAVGNGEGTAHRIARALRYARSASISTGSNHYVQFARTSGTVTSFSVFRENGATDPQVHDAVTIPSDITITVASDRWEFGFDGGVVGATGAGTIAIAAPTYDWSVTVAHATGAARVTATPNP